MNVRNHAFTLVELLVVITIVAVLVGVLLPVFGAAQENSRTAACASNLRQIGAALLSFAAENNGVLPLAGANFPYQPPAQRNGGALGWTEQLEPYAGTDRAIYVCPSSRRLIPNNVQYGYFMGCHAAYFANHNQFAAVRLSLLSAPSKYILGGDISSNSILDGANDSDKDDYTQDPGFASVPSPFHRGKVNLLFADGHVSAYAAFDPHAMTTHYDLKVDGTGYNYSDQ